MKGGSPVISPVPSNEVGQPFIYDAQFRGPVKSRSCTDVICLFLFVSFLAGWAVVSYFAFAHGDPKILLYPTDSQGNICGLDSYKDRPFLYFFDLTQCAKISAITSGCKTPQVCVAQCPNETVFVLPSFPETYKSQLICKRGSDMSRSLSDLIESKSCAALYLKSSPIIGRCIPDHLFGAEQYVVDKYNKTLENEDGKLSQSTLQKAAKFLAQFLNAKEMGKQVFNDFKSSWQVITVGLVLAMLLSLIWVVFMRWLAGIMVWLSIILVLFLSAYALYYSVTTYIEVGSVPGSSNELTFETNLDNYKNSRKIWLALAIISASVFLILILVLLYLRGRILIAIALIKEGSKAVGCMYTTLLFPVFPYVIELCVFVWWCAIALYLASSGKPTFTVTGAGIDSPIQNDTICNPDDYNSTSTIKCIFSDYGAGGNLYHAQAYNLFAFLWAVFFIIGIGQVSLSGAFSAYYWTLDKSNVPTFAMALGVYRCLRFHMGSVAFGSLLIATVRFIRIILEYFDHKCKKYHNGVTRAIACCLKCCFWMLEKFLKFISKNAYIMMAVYGKNFCLSAKTAFELLLRNVIRVVVIDKVTDFLLFVGKLVIVGVAAVCSFYVFTNKIPALSQYVPELNFNLLPVFVITFGAYIIASLFFNVYAMAVDTLFLCFLEDCERNDGSVEKPYYMSKELMKILDKKNKFRDPNA